MRKKVFIVIGTRPEAIKMVPLIAQLTKNKKFFETKICITQQHKELVNSILKFFNINPDFKLNIMRDNQDLSYITYSILNKINPILKDNNPDYAIVHGDTSTTFATALSCFYNKVKLIHIEAGLRTYNLSSPYPEEFNRQVVGKIAYIHFSPTLLNKKNLVKEGTSSKLIFVTGNTVIDTIKMTLNKIKKNKSLKENIEKYYNKFNINLKNKKIILVTIHRRENFGKNLTSILKAIIKIAKKHPNYDLILPVHPNPNIKKLVFKYLVGLKNIYLINALEYHYFVYLLYKSNIVISDSGGLQEEAPFLKKPLVILRQNSERPETIRIGHSIKVGSDTKKIFAVVDRLILDKKYYNKFNKKCLIYGNGTAALQIVEKLKKLK